MIFTSCISWRGNIISPVCVSVCLSVCPSVLSWLNRLTYDLDFLYLLSTYLYFLLITPQEKISKVSKWKRYFCHDSMAHCQCQVAFFCCRCFLCRSYDVSTWPQGICISRCFFYHDSVCLIFLSPPLAMNNDRSLIVWHSLSVSNLTLFRDGPII